MWGPVLLSILSGLLLTAGFPKLDVYYISWVSLIPLLAAVRGQTPRRAMLLGYLCGVVYFTSTMYWIVHVIDHFGGLPFPVAVLVLLLMCGYLAVYPAAFALIARVWEERPVLWTFGLPAAWTSLEIARAWAVTGFPWASIGYTQTNWYHLIQIADLTGVYGVSWLVVLGNTTIAAALFWKRLRWSPAILLLCIGLSLSYGYWRVKDVKALQGQAASLAVAVVQPSIDQSVKWDPAFQNETLDLYRKLSIAATSTDLKPDLIVWPETAAPFFYGLEEELTARLNRIIREDLKVPLLFGSPAATRLDGRVRLLNRAYLLDADGSILGTYDKQHLVPFGEYVPYQNVLFFVHRLVEAAGDFAAGNDSSPLMLQGVPLGALICYEGIFPELARATVLRGATALVNITNDAWYGDTSAPYQHLQISRWRAIEFRRPLIRAANNGISAIVDATGEAYGRIALDERGFLVREVHPLHTLTFYSRVGDLFGMTCLFFVVAVIFLDFARSRLLSHNQRRSQS